MKKIVVIVGPTAVGKTAISVELAKRFNAEIISGDSVQVYKRLDIGSAKIKENEKRGVVHHLIDIKEPGEDYSVADFQRDGRKLIDKIDLPFVVGGTGLYIKALISNYEFDASKRDYSFEEKYNNYSNQELYEILKQYDLKSCEKIHMNNRKRVLRAISAAMEDAKLSERNKKDEFLYDAFIVYLNTDREILYSRIENRVDKMIEEGLEAEVRKLYDENIFIHAIGYQEFYPYFNGDTSLDSVILEIKKNSRHLAKRQMTWFKNQMTSRFYDVNLDNINETIDEIELDIQDFLKESD